MTTIKNRELEVLEVLEHIIKYFEKEMDSLKEALDNEEITEDVFEEEKENLEKAINELSDLKDDVMSPEKMKDMYIEYGEKLKSVFDLEESKDSEQLGIEMCELEDELYNIINKYYNDEIKEDNDFQEKRLDILLEMADLLNIEEGNIEKCDLLYNIISMSQKKYIRNEIDSDVYACMDSVLIEKVENILNNSLFFN